MKRVQQTLAPLLKNGAPAQTILPGLREVDFGDWTGLQLGAGPRKIRRPPVRMARRNRTGRGAQRRKRRCNSAPASSRACVKSSGGIRAKRSRIFCHGGVIRMMLAILLDLPLPKTNSFEIEYASVTQVALHPHLNEIELLNFTPWRDLIRMKRQTALADFRRHDARSRRRRRRNARHTLLTGRLRSISTLETGTSTVSGLS